MWALWKNSNEAAWKEAIEAESLYRWKVKDIDVETTDKEDIDKLIEDYFPSYDGLFSDLCSVDANSSQVSASKPEKKSLTLQEADVKSVCALHMLLHDRKMLPQSYSSKTSFLELYEVSSLLHAQLGLIPGKYIPMS